MRNATGVLVFGLVLFATPTLGASEEAKSDEPPRGKPVTLRVGPGFSLSAADGIADVLNEEGCPTTVTTERGLPRRIGVEIEGERSDFTQSSSAGAAALARCLDNTSSR